MCVSLPYIACQCHPRRYVNYLNVLFCQQLARVTLCPSVFLNTAVPDYPWGKLRHYHACIRADLRAVLCCICRRSNRNTSVVHQTADTNHTVEIKVTQVKFLILRVINPPHRICRYASSSKTTFVLISWITDKTFRYKPSMFQAAVKLFFKSCKMLTVLACVKFSVEGVILC